MELRKGVTLVVPAKDEEPKIEAFLAQFKPYVDVIIVMEDGSTDKTVDLAKKYADQVISLDPSKLPQPTHQVEVYNEGLRHVQTEWALYADCDEIWDKGFLQHMKEIMAKHPKAMAFRFPRCNLPDGKDYPDHQVRLVKTEWTVWRCEPHIIPHMRAKRVKEGDIVEQPLDTVACETLDYPILHLPRRQDLQRPWWTQSPSTSQVQV